MRSGLENEYAHEFVEKMWQYAYQKPNAGIIIYKSTKKTIDQMPKSPGPYSLLRECQLPFIEHWTNQDTHMSNSDWVKSMTAIPFM